jgi:hypothetical protein
MEKRKKNMVLEPDFMDLQLEEIADIPERVAAGTVIDGGPERPVPESMEEPGPESEEIAGISAEYKEPLIITDDFEGRPPKRTEGEHGFDISALAAEVDRLTERVRTGKAIPMASKPPVDEPAEASPGEELVIDEDDDIDIDYYSLEELSGRGPVFSGVESAEAGLTSGIPEPTREVAPQGGIGIEEAKPFERQEAPREAVDEKKAVVKDKPEPWDEEAVGIEKDNILTFEIPEDVRGKLSVDFNIDDMGGIDLREAEKIANEEVLLLSEEDLLDELEGVDLMPVAQRAGETPRREKTADLEKHPSRKRDDGGQKKPDAPKPGRPDGGLGTVRGEAEAKERPGRVMKEISEVIIDSGPGEKQPAVVAPEAVERAGKPLRDGASDEARGKKDAADSVKPAGKRDVQAPLPDKTQAAPPSPARFSGAQKQAIPAGIVPAAGDNRSVAFIDDDLVDKGEKPGDDIFRVSELDKVMSGFVEVIEGKARLLKEANATEDLDRVAGLMKGATPTFEDLLVDIESEYSFKDDEVGVIDRAFQKEGRSKYAGQEGGPLEDRGDMKITPALEILGLDRDEMGAIEQSAFLKEYEKIDMEGLVGAAGVGMDQPASDRDISGRYDYFVTRPESLDDLEKKDIEEDVSGSHALIFEEDVEEIRKRLEALRKRKGLAGETTVKDISEKVVILKDEKDMARFISSVPREKQESLTSLLRYLDGLFEKLPEEVIKNFAASEYFELYSKVLRDLGV